jgi:hypothetical protein
MRRSGASLATVANTRRKLGLLTMPRWTPEENALLRTSSVAEVAKRTGRTHAAVERRLLALRERQLA